MGKRVNFPETSMLYEAQAISRGQVRRKWHQSEEAILEMDPTAPAAPADARWGRDKSLSESSLNSCPTKL